MKTAPGCCVPAPGTPWPPLHHAAALHRPAQPRRRPAPGGACGHASGRAPAGGQGAPRLQPLGGHRNPGGLRAALHAAALSPVVGMARGQHRVWRGIVSGAGGRGRHAAGAVRLCQRLLGHPGHGADHLSGGAAHQRVRRPLRRGHGLAHARRGLWLHRLDGHVAALRHLHLHLFCAGGRRDGLRAGAGAGRAAALGLPGVRAGGDSAGDARRLHHQPPANVDAAAVAGDAGGAVCVRAGARSWCVCRGHALRR